MFGKYRVPKGFHRFPAEVWEGNEAKHIHLVLRNEDSNEVHTRTTDARAFIDLIKNADSKATSAHIDIRNLTLASEEMVAFWNSVAGRHFNSIRMSSRPGPHQILPPVERVSTRRMELILEGGTLRDCAIGSLRIVGDGDILLENCQIGRLEVGGDNARRDMALSIIGCDILVLSVVGATKRIDINIQSSRISHSYEASTEPCPDIVGRFDRMTFAKLHKLGVENGNAKLAHHARGWELSVEHAQADRAEKPFYWLWWLFSNYGLSLWRPLVWLLAFVIACAVLLFVTGTSVGIDAAALTGWRRNLVDLECAGRGAEIVRAIVGATESVFSPFSLFSARRMVVPDLGWVATAQFFISYICVALLFLFGFSVRRRFKIS